MTPSFTELHDGGISSEGGCYVAIRCTAPAGNRVVLNVDGRVVTLTPEESVTMARWLVKAAEAAASQELPQWAS